MDDLQYARAIDGTHLAMRVLERDAGHDGHHDILMVSGGLIPLELFDDEPGFLRLVDGLRTLGRVIVFDRRGLGLSDPITDWNRPVVDQWTEDVETVARAVDATNLVVFAWDGFGVGPRFAARCPELVDRLVVCQPVIGSDESWAARIATTKPEIVANLSGKRDLLAELAPTRVNDPSFREWYSRAGRAGASPATAARIWNSVFVQSTARQQLEDIRAPTLLLHRPQSIYAPTVVDWIAEQLADVTVVELDGVDHFPFLGDVDAVVAETAEFVIGERRALPPERALSAVLFTDLVDSTRRAVSLGDARWKALLDRHDGACRAAVTRGGGRVVKSTGDGVLALFPSAGAAIRSAERMCRHLAADGLEIRVGIHVGDVDHRSNDVSGLAVNIAARVMAQASGGELFVTASVVAAVAGEAGDFETAGRFELKGVPGSWELFRRSVPC